MNTFKTTFLLTAMTLFLLFVGGALAGRGGLILALIVAIMMNGGAYFFSDKIALRSAGAVPISREESPRLYAVMERLSAKANLPMPKLYLVPQAAPNAFATGRSPSHASVAVTQGLMEIMNDDELEGVIAHELSHVRNYDILTSSIAATLAGAITMIAQFGRFGAMFGGGGYGGGRSRDNGGAIVAILMLFLAPLGAALLQLGISRSREYQADETGVKMVGHANGLISALEKLGAYNQRIPSNIPPTTAALCIVQPMAIRQFFSGLFSTHPPLSGRIARLQAMTIVPTR
jgi:heat shock protein HtpX